MTADAETPTENFVHEPVVLPGVDAPQGWTIQRRGDGAVLVRVPSRPCGPETLPDAVFTFRLGDPQYDYWEQELLRRTSRARD